MNFKYNGDKLTSKLMTKAANSYFYYYFFEQNQKYFFNFC